LYRAKSAGRDRSAVFDEAMRDEATRILDLEADLRRAINADGSSRITSDRAHRRWHRARPRSVVALAPREARRFVAGRVHRRGRGQRPDRTGRLAAVTHA
jgi:hypothetical protein